MVESTGKSASPQLYPPTFHSPHHRLEKQPLNEVLYAPNMSVVKYYKGSSMSGYNKFRKKIKII